MKIKNFQIKNFFEFETLIFKVIFGAKKRLFQKCRLTRIAGYCASSEECFDRTF